MCIVQRYINETVRVYTKCSNVIIHRNYECNKFKFSDYNMECVQIKRK